MPGHCNVRRYRWRGPHRSDGRKRNQQQDGEDTKASHQGQKCELRGIKSVGFCQLFLPLMGGYPQSMGQGLSTTKRVAVWLLVCGVEKNFATCDPHKVWQAGAGAH